MKFLRHLFTEADGYSFDIGACLGALAVVVAMVFQGYVTYHANTFDILNFSTGISALIVAVGGSQKLKPPAKDPTT